jgi:cobalt/nickel transport system permease protein
MTFSLEALSNPDSALARLDPRWKLAALAIAILCVTLLQAVSMAFAAFAAALLLTLLSRVSIRWYLERLGTFAVLLALFVALLPFLLRDDAPPLWSLGPIAMWRHGVHAAVLLCLKALTLVTLVLVLLVSAPLPATLKAARALHTPGLLVQLIMLTYRYIFVLGAELSRLRIALRVRGYRNRANRHSYRTVAHVAGTLLVRGYERAERVGQAMRCRGFDGRFRSLTAFRTTAADVAFFVFVAGGAVVLVCGDFIQR